MSTESKVSRVFALVPVLAYSSMVSYVSMGKGHIPQASRLAGLGGHGPGGLGRCDGAAGGWYEQPRRGAWGET